MINEDGFVEVTSEMVEAAAKVFASKEVAVDTGTCLQALQAAIDVCNSAEGIILTTDTLEMYAKLAVESFMSEQKFKSWQPE